jgi:hypothetical protein
VRLSELSRDVAPARTPSLRKTDHREAAGGWQSNGSFTTMACTHRLIMTFVSINRKSMFINVSGARLGSFANSLAGSTIIGSANHGCRYRRQHATD